MHKRSFTIPLLSAGLGSGVGYVRADKDEKGEGATRGALKGFGVGAGAELGALGGLAAAYQGARHLPMLPGTSKATALVLALAGAAGGGYAGHKLTDMAMGPQKKAFTLPLLGTTGSILGYRNAPEDYKGEGAFRGAIQGMGTGAGALTGAVGASALGGSYLADNQDLSPGQKALSLLGLTILGAGAGGAAGYGISRGALGSSSWENKRERDAAAVAQGLGDEESEESDEDMPKLAATVCLKMAGHVWRKINY